MPKRVCVWYGEKDEENSHSHAPLKELKTETLLVFTVEFWSQEQILGSRISYFSLHYI
jgi:hypothetical protein